MGRQAYLAKLAFGRSAFEPTQEITLSEEYVQLESSQAHLPQQYQEFNGSNYVQLYDERGNPINPRSREYGKRLRNAQNDVLAAVGVVERRRSPSEGLPGSFDERLAGLDDEDIVGNIIGTTVTLSENLCTWWIGTIRDRILTFRYHDAMPFVQIVASEFTASSKSIIYASFVPRLFSTICTQTVLYNVFVYRPFFRLTLSTQASPKIRNLYRSSRRAMKFGLRLCLEILFYPFTYHANLQSLGLIPAQPFLPHWTSVIPFSRMSPFVPFSLHYEPSASIADFVGGALTSPAILVIVGHFVERWVYATINEAVDASVICPDNPDIVSPEVRDKHRVSSILGLRCPSPPIVRTIISKVLIALGWGTPSDAGATRRSYSITSTNQLDLLGGGAISVGDAIVTNITPLELPVVIAQDEHATEALDEASGADVLAMQVTTVETIARPQTPVTPLALDFQYDDNDPRIRITSREGIVEMEVRLPPRILSTQTEIADAATVPQNERLADLQRKASDLRNRPHHRVSQLSLESSRMISAAVKAQLVGLAMLPLKLVILRLVASHYIASHGGGPNISRAVVPLPELKDLSWRPIGIQISRVAFCSALEIAVDLGLWGIQYAVSLNLGKSIFGWGTL
ncbi:hypothetical protein GQ44DRAFT_767195 [Phaeosphaeriaceae sp. PMI808]|nr:hypothetical protein GQ44DRAFT_767195 [Phaeosphaeriaceae sp. PMI808]